VELDLLVRGMLPTGIGTLLAACVVLPSTVVVELVRTCVGTYVHIVDQRGSAWYRVG
jgi:hypothetical protein